MAVNDQMEVAIFGAGYVGCVTAACLASSGHRVFLVEIVPEKLELLRAGKCPVLEPGLDEKLGGHLRAGHVIPTSSLEEAVSQSELALICVGTPGQVDGSPDLEQVQRVLGEVTQAAEKRAKPYVMALRSTVPFSYVKNNLIPLMVDRGKEDYGKRIAFALNPEFLRGGKGIEDFLNPPFIIVGTEHELAAKKLKALYRNIQAPWYVVSVGTASLLKYASNAFHAVKVAFANEIASLGDAFETDAAAVMEMFCEDRTLNVSEAYLRTGYAFGGACLPKDLRALIRVAELAGVSCPLLGSVLRSNELVVQRSVEAVASLAVRNVTLVGLSFKPGTDDLRESPMVELAEQLLGRGYRLRIYDPIVHPENLRGQNLRYVQRHLEHLASLLVQAPEEAFRETELLILAKPLLSKEQITGLCPEEAPILDLIYQLPPILPPFRILRLDGTRADTEAAVFRSPTG